MEANSSPGEHGETFQSEQSLLATTERREARGKKDAPLGREQIPVHTSLDSLVQQAPTTLIHHVHISFVVDQSGCDTFEFTGESEIQREVAIVVQLVKLAG